VLQNKLVSQNNRESEVLLFGQVDVLK